MTVIGNYNIVPGERLGPCEEYEAGKGTYTRNGFIYASRIGQQKITYGSQNKIPIIEIIRQNEPPMPSIGAIVTCKVIQTTQKQARCTIHAIQAKPTT